MATVFPKGGYYLDSSGIKVSPKTSLFLRLGRTKDDAERIDWQPKPSFFVSFSPMEAHFLSDYYESKNSIRFAINRTKYGSTAHIYKCIFF